MSDNEEYASQSASPQAGEQVGEVPDFSDTKGPGAVSSSGSAVSVPVRRVLWQETKLAVRSRSVQIVFGIVVVAVIAAFVVAGLSDRDSKPAYETDCPNVTEYENSHGSREIADNLPTPIIEIGKPLVTLEGWRVPVDVNNFRFAPERVNTEHRDGEGHLHWYVNGEKKGRLYGADLFVNYDQIMSEGQITLDWCSILTVELSANDHSVYTKNGAPIRSSVELTFESESFENIQREPQRAVLSTSLFITDRIHYPSDRFGDSALLPSVSLNVISNNAGGYLIHATPKNFVLSKRLAEEQGYKKIETDIGIYYVDSAERVLPYGFLRLYIDGRPQLLMLNEWTDFPDHYSKGTYRIRVEVRDGLGYWYTEDGLPIAAETVIQISDSDDDVPHSHDHKSESESDSASEVSLSDRDGVVHVHEDGSSHTHGAGAPKEWFVVYNSDGEFVPERVDVLAGDTVTWVNESDVGVWPASNIHPSHEILPEFDPLADIPPGESWSFRFDENGYWRYHNHSYASEVGLVVVTGGPEQDILEVMGDYRSMEFPEPPEVVDHELLLTDWAALEDFVLEYGPEATVAILFAYEIETGWQCHAAAHEIGRIAYEAFGASVFSIESHQCSTGVLHGVVEAMLAERGTANLGEDIAAVCLATDDQFTQSSCWHGVGHGVMAWTSYEIHDALELCDLVEAAGGSWGCYSGVFMENVVGGMAELTGHETEFIDPTDPHLPCNVVADKYVEPCYGYQGIHMVHVFNGNYQAVIEECMSIDEEYQVPCLRAMGANVGGVHKRQPATAATSCGLIPSSVAYLNCISGAINEMYRHPDEATYVVDLCEVLENQNTVGANECWWSLLDRTEMLLSTVEDRETFCDSMLPEGHRRQYCYEQLLAASTVS